MHVLKFTQDIRNAIIQKRESLQVTRDGLAKVLGVDSATIRRWEEGPTQQVSPQLTSVLDDFLNGVCDQKVMEMRQFLERKDLIGDRGADIMDIIKKLIDLYLLCKDNPQLQEKMVQRLDQIIAQYSR